MAGFSLTSCGDRPRGADREGEGRRRFFASSRNFPELSTGFRIDGNNGFFVLIQASDAPKADAKADWQQQEAERRGSLPGYQRISIESVQYRNYQTLINLVPGATPAVTQNSQTDTPGRSLATNVVGSNGGVDRDDHRLRYHCGSNRYRIRGACGSRATKESFRPGLSFMWSRGT